MSTHYDRHPTLEEWVRASRLIVVGRVQSIEAVKQARIIDNDEQQAVAHVSVERVLNGAAETKEVDVRFVLSRGERAQAGTGAFSEKQRLVMLLVPDVGPEVRPNSYVAYLGGAFALTNDSFVMPVDSAGKGRSSGARVTLNAVRDVVKKVAAETSNHERAWQRMEPQLAKRPDLPAVTEMPDALHGQRPESVGPADAPGDGPGGGRLKTSRRRKR